MAKAQKTVKAYQDDDFLNSSDGRTVRLLTEYFEPKTKFKKFKMMDTIVFFGSARLKSRKDATMELNKFKNANPKSIANFEKNFRRQRIP